MPGKSHAPLDAEAAALEAVRTGDPTAFGPLWDAYHPRVAAFVHRRAPRLDADDVASHVLEATLSATLGGLGPTRSTWSYLMQAARGEIARRSAALRHHIDPGHGFTFDSEPDPREPVPLETTELLRSVVESFPEQDRIVILDAMAGKRKTGAIAQDLGRDAPWVSRRIHKLRPRLQQRWIQLHVADDGGAPECRKTLAQTGRVLSGQAGAGSALKFWTHVDACDFCRPRVAEAEHSSRRLGLLLPLLLIPATAPESGTGLSGAGLSGTATGGGAGGSTVGGGTGIFSALNVTLGAGALLFIAAIVTVILIVLPTSPVHRPAAEDSPGERSAPAAQPHDDRTGADSADERAGSSASPQSGSAPSHPVDTADTAERGTQIGGDVDTGRWPQTGAHDSSAATDGTGPVTGGDDAQSPSASAPSGEASAPAGPVPTTTPCSWAPQLQCQVSEN